MSPFTSCSSPLSRPSSGSLRWYDASVDFNLLVTYTGTQAYVFLFAVAPEPRKPFPEEKNYRTLSEDGEVTEPRPLPCWQDAWELQRKRGLNNGAAIELEKPELFMSVVVPAYNEEERLAGMLEEAVNFLERSYGTLAKEKNGRPGRSEKKGDVRKRKVNEKANGHAVPSARLRGWEILIVSDGSTDKTEETAFAFAREHQLSPHPKGYVGPWTPEAREGIHIPPGSIRVVSLSNNRGKGGAVTHGMRHVRGQYVVFADADGATKFDDLAKLVTACQAVEDSERRAVAVGSRAHMVGSEAVVKVWHRSFSPSRLGF